MADLSKQVSLHSCIAVECGGCGRRFRARAWREGMVCPRCNSTQLAPAVAPGGAVDYFVADRSQGMAPADVRFAQWAKWCEVITQHQYDLAFLKQRRSFAEADQSLPIHEAMIKEGMIDEEQATRILEFLSLPRPDEDDGDFIRTLLSTTSLEREKVERVQQLQIKAATRYHEVPPLAQLLLERRVISEAQMLAVLRLQRQNGRGALKRACDMVRPPVSEGEKRGLRQFVSLRKSGLRNVALVLVLFALSTGIWVWQAHANMPTMFVKCQHCGRLSETKWSDTLPVKCPKCGNVLAYYAVICRNGHVFTWDSPHDPKPCPVCGTTSVRPFTAEDMGTGE